MTEEKIPVMDNEKEDETRVLRIDPMLEESGWKNTPEKPWMIRREIWLTDGAVVPDGKSGRHKEFSLDPNDVGRRKRADYILHYARNVKLAIVEAKKVSLSSGRGMQQAIEYAKMAGVKFAYATNGIKIEEYDFITKKRTTISRFPTPDELWNRLNLDDKVPDDKKESFLTEFNYESKSLEGEIKEPRYYQERAINAALSAIYRGEKKILLTLATGTGKTYIAFQIAWNLSKSNKPAPKILFLADRDKLADKAFKEDFIPFGDARHRIQGKKEDAYQMYFALYQALGRGQTKEKSLFELYDSDFFDYIIIDECHRGVSSEGSWRDILNHFSSAVTIGMTATPNLPDGANSGTYEYFGKPVYQYSLKQGIDDGYLAPNYIVRPMLDTDRTGYYPATGSIKTDVDGNPLTKKKYELKDYDNTFYHISRQKVVAKYIINFMKENDIFFEKTIVFCQNATHAEMLTKELINESGEGEEFVKRIVSDEGTIAKIHLDYFCDPKIVFPKSPVIAVTAELMSTGIDVPTCRLIVLDKSINSMNLFKQIVGRGTRLSEKRGKWWFTIIDFRDATRHYNDPGWDGTPMTKPPKESSGQSEPRGPTGKRDDTVVVDGIPVIIEGDTFEIVDTGTGKTKSLIFKKYLKGCVLEITSEMKEELKDIWTNLDKRKTFKSKLEEYKITPNMIKEIEKRYSDSDVFDIILNAAYGKDLKTRRQRADGVRRKKFFLEKPENAQQVLDLILEHYAEKGFQELELDENKELLDLEKFSKYGGAYGIINDIFNGTENFDKAIAEMIRGIYEDY